MEYNTKYLSVAIAIRWLAHLRSICSIGIGLFLTAIIYLLLSV